MRSVDYEKWLTQLQENRIGVIIIILITVILFININIGSNNLDKAIDRYTNETGIRIYPYGYKCLEKEGARRGLKTEDQWWLLIKENEVYFK